MLLVCFMLKLHPHLQGDNQTQPQPPPSPSREMLIDDINQLQDLSNLLDMHLSQHYYSKDQYAVSIKEDTAYPCLHSPNTIKERRSIRRIEKKSIRRIEDIVCEYSGRYQTWSLLQETPIRHIQSLGYACMTRSSTNELFTPYKEPEREFQSSRRHFKTLSLDELRSPDFNLFFDQEYSEEEEAKSMAETMEQYMSNVRNKEVSVTSSYLAFTSSLINDV
ncbi:hypothetical protein Tco_0200019 [Tanacetum coccineum]